MAESAEQKATREAAERKAEVDQAVADALAAQKAEHDAQLEAEREASAKALAEATGNPAASKAKAARGEKLYELKADVMHQPTDDVGGYVTYTKGQKVPLTAQRAAELIEAGAVVDPDAKSGDGSAGGQTSAPE